MAAELDSPTSSSIAGVVRGRLLRRSDPAKSVSLNTVLQIGNSPVFLNPDVMFSSDMLLAKAVEELRDIVQRDMFQIIRQKELHCLRVIRFQGPNTVTSNGCIL